MAYIFFLILGHTGLENVKIDVWFKCDTVKSDFHRFPRIPY